MLFFWYRILLSLLLLQLTGQPTVLYYAPALFKRLGFNMNTSATLATIGLGVVKVTYSTNELDFEQY